MKTAKITPVTVQKVARLARVPLTKTQEKDMTKKIGVTVQYISQLESLPTKDVTETSQVAGLENVYREDEIDTERMFTQEQALANAKRTHNGFFVVDAVFDEK
ncbi:hypothetical protein A3A79_05525 [Candidatus Gottesmanbacteria bacterium RIFCSPLOWO2_01_FULL_43_11b]|uniref:Aspartyl/glutamyl-tRNA(Asn/Gln) amidotransferase subunit C n=1 Tax=Candidatus Gottesmanbacteria bacterium RIFCSPLOWO2_01_FULL_43_11b TaxID=1798392 RepID=A0A1F6AIQ1_9BACT|nr:MAG: hypothetical protein A3A79_05525 [Candidatus Gottesmanbacteria bacterium RIFCSPLOWO2_01_FULL_43_11b]